mgnify:CR=1 FL=1
MDIGGHLRIAWLRSSTAIVAAAWVAAAVAVMLPGCQEEQVSQSTTSGDASSGRGTTAENATSPTPLAKTLNARYEQYQQNADDETKRIYKAGIDAVARSGVLEAAKNVGDAAPAFYLPDADGSNVALASLLEQGPVVLVWYRGGWCPYCNFTLRAFAEILPEIEAEGGQFVAVSPELPDKTAETVKENGLDFTVLSDVGNTVAESYGVVFSLTPEVHAKYNAAFGFDAHNGQDSGKLPLAATYVIGTDGLIRFAFLDADYTKRAEPAAVLSALRDLP